MKHKKSLFILIFALIASLLITGATLAQNTDEVELSQNFSSGDVAFSYPENWVLTNINTTNASTDDDNFIMITDGKITIEIYTQTLSSTVINDLSGGNLETSVSVFPDVIGLTVPATTTALETTVTLNEETFIGTFIIDAGQGNYTLLVQGRFMDEDEYVFVRVTGSAIDLLNASNRDTFLAVLNSLGTLATPDGTVATVTNNNPAPVIAPEPCLIRATGDGQTRMRVGPGNNRGIVSFLAADRDFTVIGTNEASDGSLWWRLDKDEAAPTRSANEIWVADTEVTTSGGCTSIDTVAAPPIIPVRQVSTTTTNPDVNPEPPAGSTDPFINFYADPGYIGYGYCTDLVWDLRNVQSGIFRGQSVFLPSSFETVCPEETTTYSLDVTLNSGSVQTHTTTVTVGEFVEECLEQSLPYYSTGYLDTDGFEYFYIFIDPCQTPMTIWVEMYSNEIDSLIDVYVNDVYYGTDDDSGGNLNSYMEIYLPAGTTYVAITARSFNGGSGNFEILADFLP